MAIFKRASSQALVLGGLVLGGLVLAGCAEGSDNIFTTGSLVGQPAAEAKADPACLTLASRIETLRKEGIPDKIEKAAARRYKMTQADLGKADQLTKANAEYQERRCSIASPKTTTAEAPAATTPAPKTASTKKAAKTAP
jgi:outer membrane murein-binding lipoprotein Lpp